MSNTIDNSSSIIKSLMRENTQSVQEDNSSTYQTPQKTGNGMSDTVSITDAAKQLASTEKLEPMQTDDQKIQSIKEQIANGTYEIDSKAIADKLLQFE